MPSSFVSRICTGNHNSNRFSSVNASVHYNQPTDARQRGAPASGARPRERSASRPDFSARSAQALWCGRPRLRCPESRAPRFSFVFELLRNTRVSFGFPNVCHWRCQCFRRARRHLPSTLKSQWHTDLLGDFAAWPHEAVTTFNSPLNPPGRIIIMSGFQFHLARVEAIRRP